eukprot:jgi/Hompol1/4487/HPOL_000549-RA
MLQQKPPLSLTPEQLLEAKLRQTIDTLLRIAMTVHDFQPESASVLNRRINSLIKCLAEMDDMKGDVDLQVPMDLLEVVESGVNPDRYVADLVQTLVDKNQKTNGRIDSIKMLRDQLNIQIASNFDRSMSSD